ncbi:hypothetical protein BH23GEM7_BH23GEM7_11760 [soil metagenome]|nr:hypothetical protein [Gemmatimonadota bacterium]
MTRRRQGESLGGVAFLRLIGRRRVSSFSHLLSIPCCQLAFRRRSISSRISSTLTASYALTSVSYRALHPDLFARIAGWASKTEDKVAPGAPAESGGPKHRAPFIEAWAREQLLADPTLDLVLAGHAHVPTRVKVAPGRYYVNAGCQDPIFWSSRYEST